MKNKLNDEIVFVIKENIAKDENIVEYLMDTLHLGKESIYRRLRSEIPFTFIEIVTLSAKMGFSIDHILNLKKTTNVFFEAPTYSYAKPKEAYIQKIRHFMDSFTNTRQHSAKIHHYFVKNHLPYSLSLFHLSITKFRYFKWIHDTQTIDPNLKMSDMKLPQSLFDLHKEWLRCSRENVSVTYLFDDHVFLSTIRDVYYYYQRKLITDDEFEQIKVEMLQMINDLEKMTRLGHAISGAHIKLYLLPFDLKSSYGYSESNNTKIAHVQMYDSDSLYSSNSDMCEVQKYWIDKLLLHAVYVSQDVEIQRFEYFNRQREYILNGGTK